MWQLGKASRINVPRRSEDAKDLYDVSPTAIKDNVSLKGNATNPGMQVIAVQSDLGMTWEQAAQVLESVGKLLCRQ
jgi:hypothetical protein